MATYKEELIRSMEYLAKRENSIFLGQEAKDYNGTMIKVPGNKILETPVFEDTQLGISIGLSLNNILPITLYTRMDFFILAINQLVNHLDKIKEISLSQFEPKVIIRVCIGYDGPLYLGMQHTGNYTEGIRKMVKNIKVIELTNKDLIYPSYVSAARSDKSTILIEYKELYNT